MSTKQNKLQNHDQMVEDLSLPELVNPYGDINFSWDRAFFQMAGIGKWGPSVHQYDAAIDARRREEIEMANDDWKEIYGIYRVGNDWWAPLKPSDHPSHPDHFMFTSQDAEVGNKEQSVLSESGPPKRAAGKRRRFFVPMEVGESLRYPPQLSLPKLRWAVRLAASVMMSKVNSKKQKRTMGRLKSAQRCWTVFRISLFGVFRTLQRKGTDFPCDFKSKHGRRPNLAGEIETVRLWMLTTSLTQGPDALNKALKEWCHWCRTLAVGDRSNPAPPKSVPSVLTRGGRIYGSLFDRGNCAQFARIGRAVPYGSSKVAEEALKKHKADYSKPHFTPEDVLERAYSFSLGLGAASKVKSNSAVSIRDAASDLYSRTEGGAAQELKDLAKPRFEMMRDLLAGDFDWEVQAADDYIGLYNVDDDLAVIIDAALDDAISYTASDPERFPHCRVVAINELGAKVRIVSAGPASLILAGDALRKVVWPVLKADRRVDLQLEGEPVDDAIWRQLGDGNGLVYSADLSRATDLFPRDLACTMWQGLCDGLGFSEGSYERKVGDVLLNRMIFEYADGTTISTEKGIPMGMPLSWFMLNLVQAFWITEARPDMANDPACLMRGDDLISMWNDDEIKRYEEAVEVCGGEVNKAKAFVSNDAGVFAERTIFFGFRYRKVDHDSFLSAVNRPRRVLSAGVKLELGDFVKTGILDESKEVGNVISVTLSDDIPVRYLIPKPSAGGKTALVSLGPGITAVLEEHVGKKRFGAIARAALSANSKLVDSIRKFRLPLLGPRELGGIGFPHPKGFAAGARSIGTNLSGCAAKLLASGKMKYRAEMAYWPKREIDSYSHSLDELRGEEKRNLGRLSMCVGIPENEATEARARRAIAWERVMLKPDESDKRSLQLSTLKKNLKRYDTLGEGFNRKFLPKWKCWSRKRLLDRLAMANASNLVYVPWNSAEAQPALSPLNVSRGTLAAKAAQVGWKEFREAPKDAWNIRNDRNDNYLSDEDRNYDEKYDVPSS